ncbi:MAG: hypothetical protein ACK5L5_05575 [Bacteroidales bacterium]
MKSNNLWTMVVLIVIGLCSCGGNSKSSAKIEQGVQAEENAPANIEYTVLENYFPKNDIGDETVMMVLADKADFDKYLGVAKTMTNDIVTPDFSNNVVAIVALPATNKATKLSVVSVNAQGSSAVVNMSQEFGEELSFTMRPSLVIAFPAKEELESVEFKLEGAASKKVALPVN